MKMKPPTRLVRTTASNPLVETSFSSERYCPPALLTRPSMRPWSASTVSTTRITPASSRISVACTLALPPSSAISRQTSISLSSLRPTRHMGAQRRQLVRGATAEPAAAAGDDDHPAIEKTGPERGLIGHPRRLLATADQGAGAGLNVAIFPFPSRVPLPLS